MLRLDHSGPPVSPRPAATVVIVRETPDGVEIFCVERHRRSDFLGGAIVFPGGQVDAGDHDDAWSELSNGVSARCAAFGDEPRIARAFAVAALRETLEEAAIIPVLGHAVTSTDALDMRRALESETDATFAGLLHQRGFVLDTVQLEPLARWITPVAEPKRFDTRFYLLALPTEQTGLHDERETTRSFWARPVEILARAERGDIFLAPPTSSTVELFVGLRTVAEARSVALARCLDAICPFFVQDGTELILALPGDPLHPERRSPIDSEPTRFVLRDGRFVR